MRSCLIFACVLSLSGLAGCPRSEGPVVEQVDASVGPAAASAAPVSSGTEEQAKQMVAAWSDALDKHDVDALAKLYAPRVKFYGKDLPRSTVVDIKRRALGPTSTFHQSIVGPITIAKEGDAFTATFQKRSGTKTMSDVAARIVIVDQHVREESDAPSEARAADTKRSSCEAAAGKAVAALPAVAKLLEDDKKALEGKTGSRMGGLGPLSNDEGGFSASLGVHHADRYEAQVWYEVDAKGKLSVTVQGTDVAVPAAAKATVERACKDL